MATLHPASEDTRIYEVAVLYPFPLQQKEEQQLLKGIDELFTDIGAKVVQKDVWGRRGIAYKIGGFMEGSYIIYYIDADPAKIKELDNQMKILKGVLRHLIVKPPKHYQYASYANAESAWKERAKGEEERAEREKEEKLQRQVVDKAKRQPKRVEKKKTEGAAPAESIDVQLDKLVSDDTLNI